jgi:ketosteroid isomerase-like protein
MSKENVEIVRRAIDAFNHRDVDEMVREWDTEIEVDWSRSRGPEAGIYRGQAAALGLWTAFFEMFDRATVSPDEFIECREHVVVPNRTHFRGRDHVSVDAQSAVVATVRNGRIVKWRLYQERAEALEAVGLSEHDAHTDS